MLVVGVFLKCLLVYQIVTDFQEDWQEVVLCGLWGCFGVFFLFPPIYGTVAFRIGKEKREVFKEKNYQNILN